MEHLDHEHHEPDAWHRHLREEGAPQPEHGARVDSGAVAVVLAGTIVVVIVTAVITVAYLRYERQKLIEERQLTTVSRETFNAYRAKQRVELGSYGWADRDRGFVSIPIDDAKNQILEAYGE